MSPSEISYTNTTAHRKSHFNARQLLVEVQEFRDIYWVGHVGDCLQCPEDQLEIVP